MGVCFEIIQENGEEFFPKTLELEMLKLRNCGVFMNDSSFLLREVIKR